MTLFPYSELSIICSTPWNKLLENLVIDADAVNAKPGRGKHLEV